MRKALSETERQLVWGKSKGRCWYCGKLFGLLDRWHADHVDPVGAHKITNLVLACPLCNNLKSNLSIEDFRIRKTKHQDGRLIFREEHLVYLEARGMSLPHLEPYEFWFERNGLDYSKPIPTGNREKIIVECIAERMKEDEATEVSPPT